MNTIQRSNAELIEGLVENYLANKYQLSIQDLDDWYGYRLCKYITKLQGEDFSFLDLISSDTVEHVTREINTKEYNFDNMNFEPGDIVIDIGANVGMTSIFLAKNFPFLKIYSFEPITINYKNFIKNIENNDITNNIITPRHCAITGDGRPVTLAFNPRNSGGSGISDKPIPNFINKTEDKNIKSITFDDIFKEFNLDKVKLLKIDCEGAEYEILKNCSTKNLEKVENMIGEFHELQDNSEENSPNELINYCKQYIKNVNVKLCLNPF